MRKQKIYPFMNLSDNNEMRVDRLSFYKMPTFSESLIYAHLSYGVLEE